MTSIRILRQSRGYTQAVLANQVGCSRENISRYESGARTPPLPVAAKIAAALGCTIDDLLKGTEQNVKAR